MINFYNRKSTEKFGLWNQIRIDHGREFYLMIHSHERIRRRFGPQDIVPYVQTPSTQVQLIFSRQINVTITIIRIL